MTKSTDSIQKQKKTKGPIRTEAVLPVIVVAGLAWAYFALFFDSHLRMGIELGGTYANGAEVNVRYLKTSFWKVSFDLRNLQVTDREHPQRNLVQIERIYFRGLWDALLRAKLVIPKAEVTGIAIHSPREKPGRVLPKTQTTGPSVVEKVGDMAVEQVKEKNKENVLGNLATAVSGELSFEGQLQNIEQQLASKKRLDELDKELKAKEKAWRERLDSLPQSKELQGMVNQAKAVKIDFKNPKQAQKGLKEIGKIAKEFDQKIRLVRDTGKNLNADLKKFDQDIKALDQMVKKDLADLEKKFNIPSLNTKDLAQGLFGNLFQAKIDEVRRYADMGRKYMPPKKPEEDKKPQFIPNPRGVGRTYQFGRPNSYPLFWLQRAEVSSTANESEFSSTISGKVTDVTSDPPSIGRPTVIDLAGDVPGQSISGIKAKITVDHTGETPVEKIEASVQAYPVSPTMLSDTEKVRFGYKWAQGTSRMNGVYQGGEIQLNTESRLHQIDYVVVASDKTLQQVLQGVAKDVDVITLNAGAKGPILNPRININSNLASAIANSLKRQVQEKINAVKNQIKGKIDQVIGKRKNDLNNQFAKIKGGVNQQLEGKKKEIDNAKNQASQQGKGKKNAAKAQAQKKVQKEGKKVLEGLKKKFKF